MAQKFANNAVSQLASAITDSQTQFAVLPGGGGKFPTLGADDWFMATMSVGTPDGGVQREIVRVNVRGVDQFTVLRGQEGTQALPFAGGTIIDARWTAGSAQAVWDNINAKLSLSGGTINGNVILNGNVDVYGGVILRNNGQVILQSTGGQYTGYLRADVSGMVGFINQAQNAFNFQIMDGGSVQARSEVLAGNGSSKLTANGDVMGPVWQGGWLSTHIGNMVGGRAPIRNGGGYYGYVANDDTHAILINWDNNFNIYVDGQYQGFVWTSSKFDPGSKANGGAQCQWNSGVNETGMIHLGSAGTFDTGAPWCLEGIRTANGTTDIWLRFITYRNQ